MLLINAVISSAGDAAFVLALMPWMVVISAIVAVSVAVTDIVSSIRRRKIEKQIFHDALIEYKKKEMAEWREQFMRDQRNLHNKGEEK